MTSDHVQRLAEWLRDGNFYVPETDEQITSFAQNALDASGAIARIEELEQLNGIEVISAQAGHIREVRERADQAEKRVESAKSAVLHFWNNHTQCPCGARPESPGSHPHVIGCPVGEFLSAEAALSQAQQSDE